VSSEASWAAEGTTSAAETPVDLGNRAPLIRRVMSAAARACSRASATLFFRRPGGYRAAVAIGPGAQRLAAADPGSAELVQTLGDGPIEALKLLDVDGAAVAGAIAVPVGDRGLLVIADADAPPLSAAQGYVLGAHAGQIAALVGEGAQERAKGERLRLLESVAVHARDSIVITEAEPHDLPGPRILYCNAAFTRATGYGEAEVLGKTPRLLQGPKTCPEARARIREALAAWRPIEIEMVNYRKDGSEFLVELSIVPVADETGWFTHWVSVQRDVTERKAAEELAARVRLAEVRNEVLASELQERKKVEAQLLYTAFHDDLTGLRNRAFFMDRLASALGSADDGRARPAVVFLDLDRFKTVNDSLGHSAGDTLLREVAGRLKRCTRPHDTLARIGGDEFAVLIEDARDIAAPVAVAERILATLKAPARLGAQDVFPSCSIGVVQADESTRSPEELLRDADVAMYHVKRKGRGDVAVFSEPMRQSAVAALEIEADLRRALDRGEFELAYQPIVDPGTADVAGFEALLRWRHPTRGLVSPADFVPTAEEIGLIRQIDRWVLRAACAQLGEWRAAFPDRDLYVSVNASAVELADPRFVPDVAATLAEFGLEPRCLEIEITEGLFLSPTPGVASALDELRRLGVRVALDDFGTGFSSLSYVTRYPIDTIKIDRCFTAGMCDDRRTLAIVELIVKLGDALGVTIVAEGVESGGQAALLTAMGCARVQGFHFGAPVPPSAVDALLAR